jgi:hypothetical protein
VGESAGAQRVDFGSSVPDADADGLPDAWELAHFPGLTQGPNSPGANGQTLQQNFVAGTDPNDPNSGFRLNITQVGNESRVSFLALRAEGPGYAGMTRLYSLETAADPSPTAWTGVSSVTDVAGNNQTVIHSASGGSGPVFFRGRITLQSAGATQGDSDADGLPDAWETLHFGDLTRTAGSPGLNGQTALQNYTVGTNPNDPGSVFKLSLTLSNNQQTVSFLARRAEGTGYEGKTRQFTLQTSSDPDGVWSSVPGFTGVAGSNQTVTFQTPVLAAPAFYRAQVSLAP